MLELWIFLFGMVTVSETLLLSGMTAALKTYAEHFPWLIPEGNSFSGNDMLTASSRFDMNTEKPKTLKEYLLELPNKHNTQHNYSSGTWANNSVIVVARIGDYDNETEGEWKIVAKPKEVNESSKSDENHGSKNKTESITDYFVLNEDTQKYFNEYQDLLYTFKDFVQIGVHPTLQKNISQNNNLDGKEKYFNVTYVMPIPKTKKFFEIKMSNLTQTQYNEINELLQEHLLNKTNLTEKSKGKEQEIMLVDENITGNHLKSYSHSDPLDSLNIKANDPTQNSMFMNSPSSGKPFIESKDYFHPSLTPEGFNYLLNNFDSLYFGLINKSDPVVFQTTNSPPNRIKNNGFHAEIATDYIKNDENNTKGFLQLSNNNSQDLSNINKVQVGSSRIVSPLLRRNRTKLFSQQRSKRPIISAPGNTFHINVNKLEQPISSTLPPMSENNNSEPNTSTPKTSSNSVEDISFQMTKVVLPPVKTANKDRTVTHDTTITNTSSQEWTEINKLLNNSLTKPKPNTTSSSNTNNTTETPLNSPDQILKSMNIMEAAALLIDMKKKIEEEDKKKTERYKNYLKQYLGRDEGSLFTKKDDNGNIMRINKQENILEELKLLMVDYFDSMNFNLQEKNNKSSTSAIQPILEAANIFELMEKSSYLVKSNLQIKLQAESKEPTRFVKLIVEKQAEKCKKIFKKDSISDQPTQPGSKNNINHRKFKVFTKCMNFKMVRCIVGFSQWLEKGKFYLRPHYKLERAYENYEIERNLYCLRNYNPSSLSSSPHGIRVKPPPTVNRKSGAGKLGARHNNLKLRIRKLKNGQQNGRSKRPNIERNRKYKKQQIAAQRPIIQRYSDQKGDVMVKRRNGEGKQEIHKP